MATLKEVQTQISGVKKTKQITKAMNMVAASRLRGAQTTMEAFRPYSAKFAEVLGSLAERAGDEASSLLVPREEIKKIDLILCTSDRGLCGGFNVNLIELAENFLAEQANKDVEISFINFGKKGYAWAKKSNMSVTQSHIGVIGAQFDFSIAINSGNEIIKDFNEGKVDEVYIIYSEFVNMGRQVPVIKQLLPILKIESEKVDMQDSDSGFLPEHICEPSPDALLGEMLPKSIYIQIFSAMLETSTSEHAARMTAMDNATKACNDMIDELTLLYNKARQAAITAELMDIVGGAEALKG